eukprot:4804627-Amphidinium_carterae.1
MTATNRPTALRIPAQAMTAPSIQDIAGIPIQLHSATISGANHAEVKSPCKQVGAGLHAGTWQQRKDAAFSIIAVASGRHNLAVHGMVHMRVNTASNTFHRADGGAEASDVVTLQQKRTLNTKGSEIPVIPVQAQA